MYQKFLITLFIATLIQNAVTQNTEDEYNDDIYDPTSRDFTERCNELAQYAGPKACDSFNKCCSEDFSLNKLNGDRCQNPDPKNHCSLGADGTGIGYSHCKAFNCTAEVTTTTTTTRTPVSGSPSSGIISESPLKASNIKKVKHFFDFIKEERVARASNADYAIDQDICHQP